MKQSKVFTKTRFEAPKDEVAKNAEILIRAGFIHKDMAGLRRLSKTAPSSGLLTHTKQLSQK